MPRLRKSWPDWRKAPATASSAPVRPPARAKVDEIKSPTQAVPEAAEHVTRKGKEAPGLPISRVVVNRELEKHMPGFKKSGPAAYLGFGSYDAMLREIVKGRPHLRLHVYGNGGVAISYHPENVKACGGRCWQPSAP